MCRAKSKLTGDPCRRHAIRGGFVCRAHGGAAPQVKAAARDRILDLIDPDRTLRELASVGFADVTEIYNEDYTLKPLAEWPEEMRRAVKRLEPRLVNVDPGDGKADEVLRVEFHDKLKALEIIAKHLGLLKENVNVNGSLEFGWRKAE